MKNFLIAGVLLLAVGCKEEKKCSVSVGSCTSQHAQHCGVALVCKEQQLELKCTPPADPNARQMDCQCVENGVIGKAAQVEYPPNGASAEALARTACGWK
jgi:hypothetical protein